MLRPIAETIPSVAVRSSPNGLPIAIAMSPTRTLRESAKRSGLTPWGIAEAGMLSTARSLEGSDPSTSASIDLPSRPNLTTTEWLFATTCWLVTSVPFLSTRNAVPESRAATLRTETTAGLAAS